MIVYWVRLLGVARLTAVYRTEHVTGISRQERDFGDWSEGRAAWKLDVVHVLSEPIVVGGSRYLWDWNVPEKFQGELKGVVENG